MSVVHRDLKPENLLLDTKHNIKITDFGLSAQFTLGTPLQTCCGTTLYMVSKILEGKKYHSPTADVWSLGVVLYVFITGTMPFTGDNPKEIIRKIRRGKYHIPSCVSRECKKLLKGLLVVNPLEKHSLQKIMDDEWVNLGHTEKLAPYVEDKITCDEKSIGNYSVPTCLRVPVLVDSAEDGV
nr:MAP/microtubule affinity-regulating kinase 3-like isoform X2 [Microcebus murinus]